MKDEQETNASFMDFVAISDMLAIPVKVFSPWQLTGHVRSYSHTVTDLFKHTNPPCHEQTTTQDCLSDRTILQRSITTWLLSQARGQAEKATTWAASCQVTAGHKWQMGWSWKKKNLPTGAENISLGEECLTLVKTAPAVPFITPQKAGACCVSSVATHVSVFPNTHIHGRPHYTLISARRFPRRGPTCQNKVGAWWEWGSKCTQFLRGQSRNGERSMKDNIIKQ